MIARASPSVMGHLLTFCILVPVSAHHFRSLLLRRGRLSEWQMEHLASNSASAPGSARVPAGAVSTPPRPPRFLSWRPSPPSSAPRRARCVGPTAKEEAETKRNPPAKTAPTRFPFIVSHPCCALPSLPVRGGEVLEDLRGIRVGDPVRLLPLHLLDGRRPLLLGRGTGRGPVDAVADAALLFEEGLPLLHGGYRGGRRRRAGLCAFLLRGPGDYGNQRRHDKEQYSGAQSHGNPPCPGMRWSPSYPRPCLSSTEIGAEI